MTDNTEPEMPRTRGNAYTPKSRSHVLDSVADYARDAVDAGVDSEAVEAALREAADEISEYEA